MYKSSFVQTLYARGYLHQCTNLESLDNLASSEKIVAYVGYDCTAQSLHVGNLLSIMMLRVLQKCGHQPIIIMGGGTTKVGDPSGKDEQRKMLTDEDIAHNMQNLSQAFAKYLDFTGPNKAIMVNNADWLDSLSYIAFLRDVGRHFTINKMLTFDSVRLRLEREQPLSFIEFNYMLMQAYDFVELFKRYNCRLQMGGSDQWGNIVNGVDLGRRMGTNELFGLTTPLLTTKSGKKMGKSVDGAVWLNEDLLTPYDYWQFWRNTEDDDVPLFLKLYTELPLEEIEQLTNLKGKEINHAKIMLANHATALLHGWDAASNAEKMAHSLFNSTNTNNESMPTVEIPWHSLMNQPVYLIFVLTGLAKSNSEARRLIAGKGARINDVVITDDKQLITEDIIQNGRIKVSQGQKKHLGVIVC